MSLVSTNFRASILFLPVPNMPADLIDASVANGAKGIVIAGVGNGNMNKASLEAAINAVKKGVPSSQKLARCNWNRWAQCGSERR